MLRPAPAVGGLPDELARRLRELRRAEALARSMPDALAGPRPPLRDIVVVLRLRSAAGRLRLGRPAVEEHARGLAGLLRLVRREGAGGRRPEVAAAFGRLGRMLDAHIDAIDRSRGVEADLEALARVARDFGSRLAPASGHARSVGASPGTIRARIRAGTLPGVRLRLGRRGGRHFVLIAAGRPGGAAGSGGSGADANRRGGSGAGGKPDPSLTRTGGRRLIVGDGRGPASVLVAVGPGDVARASDPVGRGGRRGRPSGR